MNISPAQILVAVGILVAWFALWRISSWKRRRALEASRSRSRLLSLFGRVTFTAGLIVGVQWVVIAAAPHNYGLLLAVLGVPALFSAYALTKALTITTIEAPRVRGGRR